MTSQASDPPALRAHATSQERRCWKSESKGPGRSARLVIVRDMWLTGFDAPACTRFMSTSRCAARGLMQAVARVNRVWKDKPGGLVVDYIGIGEELKQAIAQYTRAQAAISAANRWRNY